MIVLIEPPLGPELGPGRGLAVDETEGCVVVGGERVVAGEIEGRVVGIDSVVPRVGVVASEIGDSAEFVGAREGGEGDVAWVVGQNDAV